MENYIITNKTIAIAKNDNQTIIYDVDKVRIINKSFKKIINDNCIYYGSTLDGRKKYIEKLLNIKYKVPILISERKKLIFIPINSFRSKESLLINYNKIKNYVEITNKLFLTCINNQEFDLNISKYSLDKLLVNAIKIVNILNWQKY